MNQKFLYSVISTIARDTHMLQREYKRGHVNQSAKGKRWLREVFPEVAVFESALTLIFILSKEWGGSFSFALCSGCRIDEKRQGSTE